MPDAPPRPASPELHRFRAELTASRADLALLRKTADPGGRYAVLLDQAVAELTGFEAEVLSRTASVIDPEEITADIRFVWRVVGRYTELAARLGRLPFIVVPVPPEGLMTDLVIEVRDMRLPADTGRLKSGIDTTATIIRTVCTDRARKFGWFTSKDQRDGLARLQDEYLRQLLGIARVGLETQEPTRAQFALADLQRLQNLFTLREAGVIKNAYVAELAKWSALCAAICLGLYGLASSPEAMAAWLPARFCAIAYTLRNFALLGAGTAVGTWLSFSLRRQELGFADLAVMEPDRLNPAVRVLFMVCLAGLVGLLLFTGAITAGLGGINGGEAMRQHGSWALLVGLLAGVAERGLGAAVSRRSQGFAASLGAAPEGAGHPRH